LHYFSKDSLINYVEGFGFEKIEHRRPSKKISGKHVKSLLKYKIGSSFLRNLIPDKINSPYPSEGLFWVVFRKV
jgi:hypothetical protein